MDEAGEPSAEERRIAELLAHTIDVPVLAEAVARQQAADAADVLEDIEDEEAVEILGQLDDHAAAEALAEMRGPLAAGPVRPDWWSAQWSVEIAPDGYRRIRNRWQQDRYLHLEHGRLEAGTIRPGWHSAMKP